MAAQDISRSSLVMSLRRRIARLRRRRSHVDGTALLAASAADRINRNVPRGVERLRALPADAFDAPAAAEAAMQFLLRLAADPEVEMSTIRAALNAPAFDVLAQDLGKSVARLSLEAEREMLPDLVAYAEACCADRGATFLYLSLDTLADKSRRTSDEAALNDVLQGAGIFANARRRRIQRRITRRHAPERAKSGDLRRYVKDVLTPSGLQVQGTRLVAADRQGPYHETRDGRRMSVAPTDRSVGTVYIVGPSTAYGKGVADEHTVASHLQRLLNAAMPVPPRVENLGLGGVHALVSVNTISQLSLEPEDAVVMLGHSRLRPEDAERVGIDPIHIRFDNADAPEETFIDAHHLTPASNAYVAGRVRGALEKVRVRASDTFAGANDRDPAPAIDMTLAMFRYLIFRGTVQRIEAASIAAEVDRLKQAAEALGKDGRGGAIVVNCDPFTSGHQHVITRASQSVDRLYVFVIDEDLSFFSAPDRLAMVAAGTHHLPNVCVVTGGRYVCSSFTTPEYFTRSERSTFQASSTVEAWLLAEHIGPELGIHEAFLGEEPDCAVTRQINGEWAGILESYGWRVTTFERKQQAGHAISASRVRRAYQSDDLSAVADLVPETTIAYLRDLRAARA